MKHFREITQAANEAKANDPDEIDRRETNKHRRRLMSILAAIGLMSTGGVIYLASRETTNLVALGIVSGIAMVSIAFTGILASGGTLSPRVVLNVLRTATGQQPPNSGKRAGGKSSRRGGK